MMNHKLKFVLLASLLPFTVSAAQELTPWYVGGLGVNNYEHICDLKPKMVKMTHMHGMYSQGYMFNDYFGAEIGFRNLGNADWTDYGATSKWCWR